VAERIPWWSQRLGSWSDLRNTPEWSRFLVERLLVAPAGAALPLRAALTLSAATGFVEACVPTGTTRRTRLEVEAATGRHGMRALELTGRRLAATRRDLVYKSRASRGRDRDRSWTFVESNPEGARAVITSGSSYILATGHFEESAVPLVFSELLRDAAYGCFISGAPSRWRLSPRTLRARLSHLTSKSMREALFPADGGGRDAHMPPNLWDRPDGWGNAPAKTTVQDQVLAWLEENGTRLRVSPDAIWEKKNAYRRPFAGAKDRGFALGAARIARLGQHPILPVVAVMSAGARTVRVDWGDPIEPPGRDDDAQDRPVMDRILDFLELAVARYPDSYRLPIGWERVWDDVAGRWQPRGQSAPGGAGLVSARA
jgi:hypothetical protein